ncbi:MAG TPA: hypothetical protein VGE67_18340 [Haloferula sp.]
MNISPAGLIAAGILACTGVTQAVTITSSTVSTSTTVSGNTVSTNPGSQTISGTSQISSQGTALTQTNLGAGSWEFNGLTTASLSATRGGNGANNAVAASAVATYTIAFSLGVGESATVKFNTGYGIGETGVDGLISWSLTGAQTGFSGSVTAPATGASITPQQVTLTTAGNYTFTLTGAINGPISRNQSATVTLSNTKFEILAVPEPTAAVLGSLGVGLLMFRRRRIPS